MRKISTTVHPPALDMGSNPSDTPLCNGQGALSKQELSLSWILEKFARFAQFIRQSIL